MTKKIIGVLLFVSMLISNVSVFAAKSTFEELYPELCVYEREWDIELEYDIDAVIYPSPEMNWSNSGIKVAVDGVNIDFPDTKPALDANTSRTYVPVRFLAEQLGAQVDWDNEHQVVMIRNKGIEGNNTKLVHFLKIGSNKYVVARFKEVPQEYVNQTNYSIIDSIEAEAEEVNVYYMPTNVMPVLKDGRTMLPFRYVAELMGSPVYYDDSTGTAHCLRKDFSKIIENPRDRNYSEMGMPIFSTIIEPYWIESINAYRKANGVSRELLPDGTYSDMMVWAAINQMENPQIEQHGGELANLGLPWMHAFKIDDENKIRADYTLRDGTPLAVTAYRVFVKQFIPNSSYAEKIFSNYIKNSGYSENAFTGKLNRDMKTWSIKNSDNENKSVEKMYLELYKAWNIKIKKQESTRVGDDWQPLPLEKYEEYNNINIYDAKVYREIATNAIKVWRTSQTHNNSMLSFQVKRVGFGWIGNYCYSAYYETYE